MQLSKQLSGLRPQRRSPQTACRWQSSRSAVRARRRSSASHHRPEKASYELAHAEGYHSILTLKIAGDKPQEHKVLIQDYNAQPVSDILLHVDFMAMQDDKP